MYCKLRLVNHICQGALYGNFKLMDQGWRTVNFSPYLLVPLNANKIYYYNTKPELAYLWRGDVEYEFCAAEYQEMLAYYNKLKEMNGNVSKEILLDTLVRS